MFFFLATEIGFSENENSKNRYEWSVIDRKNLMIFKNGPNQQSLVSIHLKNDIKLRTTQINKTAA